MRRPNQTMILKDNVLGRAFLEMVIWWVDCENEFHNVFKNISPKHLPYNAFYDFTKKYSVRRTLKKVAEKQKATDLLLDDLKDKFINEVMAGRTDCVDNFGQFENNNIISLLSKFATLIKPTSFTMYDGNAAKALRHILYNRKTSDYKNYSTYITDFTNFKTEFEQLIQEKDIIFWLEAVLYQRFKIDPLICTREIFLSRLADKYLWCYCEMEMKQ